MKLTKIKFYILACFTFLVSSCTITTTKTKDPVFNDISKVQNELTSLVKAENINLNGKEITKNKKAISELEVSITNAENIPTSDDERKALGKTIASAVKSNLKDANQFNTYQILFVTKTENGGVIKRKWVGNVFSSTEL